MLKIKYLCFCLLLNFLLVTACSTQYPNVSSAEATDNGDHSQAIDDDKEITGKTSSLSSSDTDGVDAGFTDQSESADEGNNTVLNKPSNITGDELPVESSTSIDNEAQVQAKDSSNETTAETPIISTTETDSVDAGFADQSVSLDKEDVAESQSISSDEIDDTGIQSQDIDNENAVLNEPSIVTYYYDWKSGGETPGPVELSIPAAMNNIEASAKTPAEVSGIRKGQRRPAEQFSIDLFDRPLTIGGSFDALWNQESDLAFDDYDDDYTYTQYTLSLELFYEITESVSFFADGALFYSKFDSERQTGAERYQTWVYFEEIFDSDFDIKLGAQYFSDERAWWWDDDQDAVSLQYWGEHWQAELAFTQSLARESTTEDFIDPAEEDLNRLLTRVSWEHLEDHWLEFFYVVQNDHSATESVDSSIDSNKLDDTDADLQWIGIRSYGYRDIGNNGEIDYWLDTAYMDGDETLISTADTANPAKLLVDGVSTDAVHGWAFDLGLTWHTEFPLNPSFTLGYAVGSGKLDEQGDLNTAYQQTGLQSNSNYFTDVNYIAYYGELLYPELSNLKIWTLGVSVPLLENTALDLMYHQYDQYVTAGFLRNAGLGMDPNGDSKDIGQEIDIIFRALEFVHWEYGITAAFFQAGDAFDSDSGEIATSLSFDLRYNF